MTIINIENLTIIFDSGLTSEQKNEALLKEVQEASVSAPETFAEQVDTNTQPTVKQALDRMRLHDVMKKLGCSESFLASIQLP
jgi:hypothetical protein